MSRPDFYRRVWQLVEAREKGQPMTYPDPHLNDCRCDECMVWFAGQHGSGMHACGVPIDDHLKDKAGMIDSPCPPVRSK